MHKRVIVAIYRIGFALLAFAALIYQFKLGLDRPTFTILNFFSFFTIESNILAAAILLVCGVLRARGISEDRLALWRGAATLYMSMTGVIYTVLLAGLEESLQTATPWVNTVLHYLMPVVVLADWFMTVPQQRILLRQAAWWLVFPVAYVTYSLLRGPHAHWYPYPFLNPGEHGYVGVLLTCAIILPVLVLFVWLLAWTTRLRLLPVATESPPFRTVATRRAGARRRKT